MAETTRSQHMQWCKDRAIQELDSGNIQGAFASMASDLGRHPETTDHGALELGMVLMMGGHLKTDAEMRKFIEGFN